MEIEQIDMKCCLCFPGSEARSSALSEGERRQVLLLARRLLPPATPQAGAGKSTTRAMIQFSKNDDLPTILPLIANQYDEEFCVVPDGFDADFIKNDDLPHIPWTSQRSAAGLIHELCRRLRL